MSACAPQLTMKVKRFPEVLVTEAVLFDPIRGAHQRAVEQELGRMPRAVIVASLHRESPSEAGRPTGFLAARSLVEQTFPLGFLAEGDICALRKVPVRHCEFADDACNDIVSFKA